MPSNTTFVPRSRDVASEDFDGEFVVLDLASGKYFSLLGGSATVWRGLMAGHSTETLCSQLADGDPRRSEISTLIANLVDHGLIVPGAEPGAPPEAIAAEIAAADGPFKVDMFDDLADLLVADPIHDVDQETGWPVMPPRED